MKEWTAGSQISSPAASLTD